MTTAENRLTEPWSQLIGDLNLNSSEAWAMSEQQPDQIHTEAQEPATEASAIYEPPATDSSESGSEFSSYATLSKLPAPEISTTRSGENLIDSSLQQQGDRDKKGDPEALIHTSAALESASSSNAESSKTMKTSTKDS